MVDQYMCIKFGHVQSIFLIRLDWKKKVRYKVHQGVYKLVII